MESKCHGKFNHLFAVRMYLISKSSILIRTQQSADADATHSYQYVYSIELECHCANQLVLFTNRRSRAAIDAVHFIIQLIRRWRWWQRINRSRFNLFYFFFFVSFFHFGAIFYIFSFFGFFRNFFNFVSCFFSYFFNASFSICSDRFRLQSQFIKNNVQCRLMSWTHHNSNVPIAVAIKWKFEYFVFLQQFLSFAAI